MHSNNQGKVIKKVYTQLEHPKCPNEGNPLVKGDDEGCWYCDECDYDEVNNITICKGEDCENLILASSDVLDKRMFNIYELFCDIPQKEGGTCLGFAQHEADELDQQDYEIRQAVKGHLPGCPCYICVHY